MREKHEPDVPPISIQQMVGKQPLRDAIHRHLKEPGATVEKLSKAMGFDNPKILRLYVEGVTKIPLGKFVAIAADLNLDVPSLTRLWLKECAPDVLEVLESLPAPPLLSESERRMVRHLRSYTDHPGTELIVADGANLVALVMAR